MFIKDMGMFLWAALLIALSASPLSAQKRVVDLTNAASDLAEWKIVASGAGGSLGSSSPPPSHQPVTLHLTKCAVKDKEFFFSVEIENNRKVEIQIPISMNSKQFDHAGTISFTELLIRLGTATDIQDPSTFNQKLPSVELFGSQSVPSTMALLAPGEHLVLHLKSKGPSKDQDISSLHARIGGVEVTLTPRPLGYAKNSTWINALSANSESPCSANRPVK
jgi:hypothetical protein